MTVRQLLNRIAQLAEIAAKSPSKLLAYLR